MPGPTKVRGLGPRTPLSEAARRLVSARLGDALRSAARLSSELEPEMLHDLRVAVRRLRAALGVFDHGLDRLALRAKELQDALGAVRDLQVEIAWLGSIGLSQAEIEPLIAERQAEISERARVLEELLPSWRVAQRLPAGALDHLSGKLGGKETRRALRRRLRKVERRFAELHLAFSVRGAHEARIAVKKLRYVTELLSTAFPEAGELLLRHLVPLQRDLGDLHDSDVWSAHWGREAGQREGASRDAALSVTRAADGRRRNAVAAVRRELARWHKAKVGARVIHQVED
jgi:CHAD domain-containing protein